MVASRHALIDEGRAALRDGDPARARLAYGQALEDSPGAAHEGLGTAAYISLAFLEAVAEWEQAYASYREASDNVGAVRMARTLCYIQMMIVGDQAVAGGWLARAKSLLGGAADSSEAGWVALNTGMFDGDRGRKEQCYSQALVVARQHGDADLEFAALAYLGASLVHSDRTEEGMVLLDEALAAVVGGEVDQFIILEEIFCQLFSACERAQDVIRADQWIRVGNAVATKRNLPSVAAYCHTHYGAVLTAAGRWPEADIALTEAVRLWGLGQNRLRLGALVRLADLRVRQGRFEDAEALLDGLHVDAETARPLAALQLARGETALARDTLERALSTVDPEGTAAAPILALLVDIHLARGDLAAAEATVDALAGCVAGASSRAANPYLAGIAALARGRLCLATGTGDPRAWLRDALDQFAAAQLPMEAAWSRLELASALVADHPEVAIVEARAALEAFERLRAARHVDAATAVLRTLGVKVAAARKGDGVLTKREAEILDLLGHGLSNPEIAERLFISRKTVEHHVGNILSKLGLRSRAQAAAYAVREKRDAK